MLTRKNVKLLLALAVLAGLVSSAAANTRAAQAASRPPMVAER